MIAKIKRFFFEEMDMTTGNLFLKIGRFALPLFLTTVLQLLYSTVDLITVHFLGGGSDSMAAVAANGSLINLVITVFSNMALGSNVSVGNAKGAGDAKKAERVLHTSLIFSSITGICVGIVGFFASHPLLELMGTSDHLIDLASQYLKIYFVGLPFLMIYNYLSQIMRAIGDSSTPFLALFIAGLVNVGTDILFVSVFNMDVSGVAWATVISQGVSALILILAFAIKKGAYIHLHWKELRISKDALGDIIKIGLPAGLQGFFFALPNVFIQAKLYTVDPGNADLENGAIASGNIESYIFAGIEAVTAACLSFTAQNFGAQKESNIKKAFRYSLIWVFIFSAVASLIIIFAYRPLLSLYVDTDEAINAGRNRLFVVGLTYSLDGVMGIASGSLRGCRKSLFPMISTLLGCTVLRILLLETAFNLEYFHTVYWLYSVFPISWVVTSAANLIGWKVEEKKIYASFSQHV